MPERIFINADGKELRREPMKRGRPPRNSYKDSDGNLICPVGVPEKKDVPKKENTLKKEATIKAPVNISQVITEKNSQSIKEAYRMTLKRFTSGLFPCGEKAIEENGDILIYRNVYIGVKLYLEKYDTNLFNAVVPIMTIDPKNNIIRIWASWYGSKKKKDDLGNIYYDFNAVQPKYIITGLLRPDEEN